MGRWGDGTISDVQGVVGDDDDDDDVDGIRYDSR